MMTTEGEKEAALLKEWGGDKKNLYLTFNRNSWIWGIKPFASVADDKFIQDDDKPRVRAQRPEVECNAQIIPDPEYTTYGAQVFELDSKAYIVSGTKAVDGKFVRSETLYRDLPVARIFEFDLPQSNGCFLKIPTDLRSALPTPMPVPIVAKVNGELYLLYGGQYFGASYSGFRNCFYHLRRNEGSDEGGYQYHWEVLPCPPFYGESFFTHYKSRKVFWGVIANKLCGRTMYKFDVATNSWEMEDYSQFRHPQGSITLSSKSWGGGDYYVDIYGVMEPYIIRDCWNHRFELIASLVDNKGNRLLSQDISWVLPDDTKYVDFFKLIEPRVISWKLSSTQSVSI